MDVFRNAKATGVTDAHHDSYTFASFQRGGEARVQIIRTSSWFDEDICVVEIDADDAGRFLERLNAKSETWGNRFKATAGEVCLTASRSNSGDPYTEGFDIEVQEIKAGNDWGERVFGGYFEDGHYLDNIKEILQHCVDLDQKLKAAPAP